MFHRSTGAVVVAVLFLSGAWVGSQVGTDIHAADGLPSHPNPSQGNKTDVPPPKITAPARIGFVSTSEFMKKSKKWQAQSAMMVAIRDKETKRLAVLRTKLEAKKEQAAKATGEDKQDLDRAVIEETRKFEDDERATRADLDRRSMEALKAIHKEFASLVDELAAERGLDVVYACPTRMDRQPEGTTEAEYLDAYFRPQATIPIYMKNQIDLTDDLVLRVNRTFDAADRPPAKD